MSDLTESIEAMNRMFTDIRDDMVRQQEYQAAAVARTAMNKIDELKRRAAAAVAKTNDELRQQILKQLSKPDDDLRSMDWNLGFADCCRFLLGQPLSEAAKPFPSPQPLPEPNYRQFDNAAEFAPHRERWWQWIEGDRTGAIPPVGYSDQGHGGNSWEYCFTHKVFDDGSPFGVKVSP